MKDLLLRRGLTERERMMLAREREDWGEMVHRWYIGRYGHISFRFRNRHPPSLYVGGKVCIAKKNIYIIE